MALSQTTKQVVGGVLTPTIANIDVPLADTETTYALPVSTQRFLIRSRTGGVLKISYILGDSGSIYITIHPGAFYEEDDINTENLVLYFQTNKSSDTIEIVSWV